VPLPYDTASLFLAWQTDAAIDPSEQAALVRWAALADPGNGAATSPTSIDTATGAFVVIAAPGSGWFAGGDANVGVDLDAFSASVALPGSDPFVTAAGQDSANSSALIAAAGARGPAAILSAAGTANAGSPTASLGDSSLPVLTSALLLWPSAAQGVGPDGATPAQVRQALDANGLSVTGAGVKVGVLSDSFDDLGGAAADEADGALPPAADVQVLKDLASGGTDEGRAMMQIVHDIAPGASLAFYTADDSEQGFANGILALAADGCKVICDDITYLDEPFFQTDVVATAIATVEQEGVTVLTSAGNQAAAAYQSCWTPIACTSYDGQTLTDTLSFGGSPVQTVTFGDSAYPDPTPVILQWNEPYGDATSDLAMVVFSGGDYLGTFTNEGSGNPDVQVDFGDGYTYQIAIEDLSGPNPTLVKDLIYNDSEPDAVSLSDANAGTVIGHHASPYAITVGAAAVADTPAFGVAPAESEAFSSSGAGTQLWFNCNGTALATPEDLAPVAVTGVDGVETTVPGLTDFYGTSAATPSVAGVVALMLQENPNLTPAQIGQILEESALPMANPAVSGAGLVQAAVAVALAAPDTEPTVNVQNVSVGENQAIPASAMITSISNPSNDSITQYGFEDDGGSSGYFTVNGTVEPDGQPIYVAAADPGNVQYVGGSAPGSDTIAIDVYDSTNNTYSNWSTLTATTTAPPAPSVDLFSFRFDYDDFIRGGKQHGDFYLGTVADNGTLGYYVGETIRTSRGVYHVTADDGPTTTEAEGTVNDYAYWDGAASKEWYTPYYSSMDGASLGSGLGNDYDYIIGPHGHAHLFGGGTQEAKIS
jgi:hypothetical protein